jgi:hypothetical protein
MRDEDDLKSGIQLKICLWREAGSLGSEID